MTDTIDYGEDTMSQSQDALAQLTRLAGEQAKAEAAVLNAEAELKKAQDILSNIAEREIPNLMAELGMEKFKTSSGIEIEIDSKLRASIPKPRTFEAIADLEKIGNGDLVKRSFTTKFTRDQKDEAQEFAKTLRDAGFNAEEKQEVHPQTLSAWIKEQLEKGVDIPMEMFGAFWQRRAKIK